MLQLCNLKDTYICIFVKSNICARHSLPSCLSNAPPAVNDWHTEPGYTSSGWSASLGVLSLVQFQKLISWLLLRISLNGMGLLCSSQSHLPSYEQWQESRGSPCIYTGCPEVKSKIFVSG